MALTYTQLTALVRNWANRNVDVVSDSIIQDSLKYAADKAYRTLRIPPLENVATYSKTELETATMKTTSGLTKTEIRLPADLIEFIQIKELDENGATVRVFNEKLDIRTFNDVNAEKYSNMNYWARQRNSIYLTPGFNSLGTANSIELLYYRRLPALDAKYAVSVLNYASGYLRSLGTPTTLPLLENQKYLYFTTAKNSIGMNFITAKINVKVDNNVNITNDNRSGVIVAGQELSGVGVTANPTTGKPPRVLRTIDAATNVITALINVAVNNSNVITNDNRSSGTVLVGDELSGIGVTAHPTGRAPKVINATNQDSITVDTNQTLADDANITFSTQAQNTIEVDTAQTLEDNADIVFSAVNRTTAYNTQSEAITASAALTPANVTAKVNGRINGSTTITNDGRSGTVLLGQELSGAGVVNNSITGAPPKVIDVTTPNSIIVDTAQILADNVDITFSNTNSTLFIGNEIPNWLRDQNERVILMGALAEVFSFTQEDDQAQKYLSLFMSEIKELNDEDATRNASGGNLQVNFNGRGLI